MIPISELTSSSGVIVPRVDVRMYCMGTGDCLVLKFFGYAARPFTMLIDCGSCMGGRTELLPYVQNLADYVENQLDLLVITHEHLDHVSGFALCQAEFEGIHIAEAWLAWTEDPTDPDGRAQELLTWRSRMRHGLRNALAHVEKNYDLLASELTNNYANQRAAAALDAFLDGLHTLSAINLEATSQPTERESLAGMRAIREILQAQQARVRYLLPGQTQRVEPLPGVCFYVLGPPLDPQVVHKDGRKGKDVYAPHALAGENSLAVNSFLTFDQPTLKADLPFAPEYTLPLTGFTDRQFAQAPPPMLPYLDQANQLLTYYTDEEHEWRQIENEWLYTAGSLAIRLDSHINNTSLALAVELGAAGPVLLLPGDAEFASWASWHRITHWQGNRADQQPTVADLLGRTVFYKVSHHLSYNGTPIDLGIRLMTHPDLTAMVTLDRQRIQSRWKSTMPNRSLLRDLIDRCKGRCFIMSESEIADAPSAALDPATLGADRYQEIIVAGQQIAKQVTFHLS